MVHFWGTFSAALVVAVLAILVILRLRSRTPEELDLEIFRRHPQPTWIYDPKTLEFLAVNDIALRTYGYTRAEFLALHVDDIEMDVKRLRNMLQHLPPEPVISSKWKHRLANGQVIDVDVRSQAIRYRGRAARIVTAVDTTEREQNDERLRMSEAALATAQQIANLGSFTHDLKNDVRAWTREMYVIYGLDPQAPHPEGGLWIFDHPDDAERVRDAITHARKNRETYDIDHRIIRMDGAVRHVHEQGRWIYDEDGKELQNLGTVQDITDRKEAEAALAHLAYHDSLTGLPNRTRLVEQLENLLQQGNQRGLIALLFLDLDRFKIVNDTLGHRYGDDVLREIGARLRARLRPQDMVARPGGDEFIVVLPEVPDKLEVSRIADIILDAFKRPFMVAGHEHFISGSIGVSLYPVDGSDVETLLQAADAAMYAAKQRGGNNFHFYTANLQYAAARRFRLESALHRALERSEFTLHYQPILSVERGQIVGAEALLRWNDPDTGMVLPSEFVPFAEETGLIVPIGDFVFKEACVQAKLWSAGGQPAKIWVNVSAPQLHHPNLVGMVRERLALTGLDPSLIGLELTESAFISGSNEVIATMRELKGMGVSLALDDFGVAYSSLDYLRRLPIDTIKIDRSFLRDIATDRFNQSIVRAIVGIAHDLDLRVSAEGVETTDQYAFLADLGCDDWQGFYYAEAEPAAAFSRMMRSPRAATSYPGDFSGRSAV